MQKFSYAVKVKCRQNLISSGVHQNNCSDKVTSISDGFFSHTDITDWHVDTSKTSPSSDSMSGAKAVMAVLWTEAAEVVQFFLYPHQV